MKKDEIIVMLEIVKTMAEPVQLPDTSHGFGTLISEVNLDTFLFVINSALSILREGGNT